MSGTGGAPISTDEERAQKLTERMGLAPGSIRIDLALEALRHGSWLHEQRFPPGQLRSNERLEFLGDSILGMLISQRCCDRFPDFAEGGLTRLRAALVKAESLAAVARSMNLGELLLLGRGEERSGGREKQNLLADALEAAVAAVFVSSGLAVAAVAVDHLFEQLFEQARDGAIGRDYKTELQEIWQGSHRSAPTYQVIDAPGPQHARTFEVEVQFLGGVLGRGTGRTKKDAEQAAARAALESAGELAAAPPAAEISRAPTTSPAGEERAESVEVSPQAAPQEAASEIATAVAKSDGDVDS